MLKLQLIWGDNLGNLVNRAVSLCGGSVPSGKVSVPPPFNLKELKTAVKDVQTSGAARRRNTRILLSRNEWSKWAFQPDWSCIFPSIYRNMIGTCMSSQVCIAGILIQPISSNSNSRSRTCMAWGLWILSSFGCGSSCDWGSWKNQQGKVEDIRLYLSNIRICTAIFKLSSWRLLHKINHWDFETCRNDRIA